MMYTRIRFEKEVKGNSEMVYYFIASYISLSCYTKLKPSIIPWKQ